MVILGGGIAGLAAAHELRRRDRAVHLHLLEARQQLGGRVFTARDPETGEPLELGAEFVHGRPPALLEILRAAKVSLGASDAGGEDEDSPFSLMPRALAPLVAGTEPDSTIASYLGRQKLSPHALRSLRGFVEGFYVAPWRQASARAIGRMEVAAAKIHGNRAAQLPTGYDGLVRHLAKALRPAELRLGAVATALSWQPGRVKVAARSLAGAVLPPLVAEAAIVALPFSALAGGPGAVTLRPALPDRQRAAAALRMGPATKVFLRFDETVKTEPFFYGSGAIPVWWTAAAPDSRWLVGWAGGRAAHALDRRSDDSILRAALASLAPHLRRSTTALGRALTGFRCFRWSREPFFGGAYAYVPLGADGAMASLARPEAGTLFFAGEATSPEHAGTVHGAYESGVRAAGEALNRA